MNSSTITVPLHERTVGSIVADDYRTAAVFNAHGIDFCCKGGRSVAEVCQAKGCWLELKQGDQAVHVTFEGYSFFVPKDSAGKSVRLEGKVAVKEPKPEEVEHKKAEGAASAGSKVSVVATGVELR